MDTLTLRRLITDLRERHSRDMQRGVRYGEPQKAILSLGALDALDELVRAIEFHEDAQERMRTAEAMRQTRKRPGVTKVSRQHDYKIPAKEGAMNGE